MNGLARSIASFSTLVASLWMSSVSRLPAQAPEVVTHLEVDLPAPMLLGAPGTRARVRVRIVSDSAEPAVIGWQLGVAGRGAGITFHSEFGGSSSSPDDCGEFARLIFGPGASGDEVAFCSVFVVDPDLVPASGPLAGAPQGPGLLTGINLKPFPTQLFLPMGESTLVEFSVEVGIPEEGEAEVELRFQDGFVLGTSRAPLEMTCLAGDFSNCADFRPETVTFRVRAGTPIFRGDSNADLEVDVSDAIFSLSALFLGAEEISCEDAADANDSGELGIEDPIVTLRGLFLGETGIAAPGPGVCAVDESPSALTCEAYPGCRI